MNLSNNELMEQQVIATSDQLAYIFFKNKMFDLAEKQSDITLEVDPLNPSARFNAAKCSYYNNNFEKAIDHINTCLLLDPDSEQAKRELALYLPWVNRYDEALDILNTLPKDHRTKFNLAWYKLKENNIKDGMKLLENGRFINCWGSNNEIEYSIPKWNGENLNSKKILIITEGGLGDEIIFCRFAKNLKDIGCMVDILCSPELRTVISRIEGVSNVVDNHVEIEKYDYWIPSMSLPSVLQLDRIDGRPYLTIDEKYINKWKNKISSDKLKIGIRWKGGPYFEFDQRRTLPVFDLIDSLENYGELFSLQKETEELLPDSVLNLENELETWEDTLAVISLLDVVITSCTSIAHVSAALGKKTFVIVPIVSYFTWAKDGDKSDWYDNIVIFRQTKPNSWSEPISKVVEFLNL